MVDEDSKPEEKSVLFENPVNKKKRGRNLRIKITDRYVCTYTLIGVQTFFFNFSRPFYIMALC